MARLKGGMFSDTSEDEIDEKPVEKKWPEKNWATKEWALPSKEEEVIEVGAPSVENLKRTANPESTPFVHAPKDRERVERRTVHLVEGAIESRGISTGRRVLFAYDYSALALSTGISVSAVRQSVQRGELDPRDLVSVARFITKRLK